MPKKKLDEIEKIYAPFIDLRRYLTRQVMTVSDVVKLTGVTKRQLFHWRH